MATIEIRDTKKYGRTYKFRTLIGTDENGVRQYARTTWKPPEGLSPVKEKKLAEAEAYRWEQEIKNGKAVVGGAFSQPRAAVCDPSPADDTVPEEETLRYFAEQIWMPFKVIGGGLRPSTIAMYRFMLKVMLPKLGDKRISEVTGIDIMQFLQYLRDEYRAPNGKKVSEKTIKHHFDIIRILFNYAEKQEVIEKNPIKKVDPPRMTKRPVDALTQEQAKVFFKALSECKLEYRCMMLLLATTGVRRGECLGLQWRDFDFEENTLHIERNVTYDAATHTLYADINAGADSKQAIDDKRGNNTLGYAMLRVGSHELTHHLEVSSPEMYGKYKAAVRDALKSKGEDMAMLARQKLDNAYANGQKLSYEGAVAEVIADASEYMLQDSKFTNDLDPTLKGRIKTFIQNFMGKVKEILTNLTGAHRESKALREMVDGVYHYTGKLQELWDASLQETLGQETSDHSGGVTEMAEGHGKTFGHLEGVKNSLRDVDVSYDTLVNKADMRLTTLADNIGTRDRKAIAQAGYVNASQMGHTGKSGMPAVFVEDIGREVHVSKKSLEHGLDRRTDQLSAATQHVGELLKSAILINTANPKLAAASDSYILLSAGENADGTITPVSFVVNSFTNEMEEFDVLKSMKQKQNQSRITAGIGANALLPTDSTISIAELIDLVKNDFTDVWSNDVITTLGLQRKPTEITSSLRYSLRDLPEEVTVRDYLAELKPTDRMNETEKLLLKRYQDTLGKLREAERNTAEQNEIIKTATGDELTKAKNRWQIYRNQANRYARELGRAERNEGFAALMATGQKMVNQYLAGGYNRIADAQDALETEIRSLGEQLKAIGKTVEGAEQGQKTAHARGLFNQGELNAAAKRLKDSYGSRMSIKEISNRLALAYGEIYASNGAEGAKRFADAAKDLAQDIMTSSKYRYRSETLTMIAEEIPTISLTEMDKQEIKNAGLTITEYKRGISPFVKVADGASDLSSYVSNAEAYGGQIVNILGTDTEGDLAMALYNVIQAEKQAEGAGTFEGMTEGESLSAVMVDIMSANLPMTTDSSTLDYLRKEMLKYAGESQAAAKAVEGAIQSVKNATKRASSLWHRAVQEVELSEHAIDYYRALEEQRRMMELQDQKKELTEQLKSDAVKKIHEQVEKQRTEYREREQRAREYRKTRDEVDKLRRGIGRKVKRLNALRVRETDQKHVPQELQHVADLVMQTFTDSSLGRLAFSQEKLNSLSHRYQMLKELESDSTYFWDDEIEMDITNLQALGEAYSALRNREGDVKRTILDAATCRQVLLNWMLLENSCVVVTY